MSPTDLEILKDALHCLRTYRRLAPSEIRPYGRHGHPIDTVVSNLQLVIAKHGEITQHSRNLSESHSLRGSGYTRCKQCGAVLTLIYWDLLLPTFLHPATPFCSQKCVSRYRDGIIPQLRAIKTRPVTLDKEAWR